MRCKRLHETGILEGDYKECDGEASTSVLGRGASLPVCDACAIDFRSVGCVVQPAGHYFGPVVCDRLSDIELADRLSEVLASEDDTAYCAEAAIRLRSGKRIGGSPREGGVMAIRWEDEPSATNDVDELRKEFRERLYVPVITAPPRSSITSYAQIEAIHEAMRELAMHRKSNVYIGDDGLMPLRHYHAEAVDACLAKIRAALAGETKPIAMSAEGLAALDELKKRLNDGSP